LCGEPKLILDRDWAQGGWPSSNIATHCVSNDANIYVDGRLRLLFTFMQPETLVAMLLAPAIILTDSACIDSHRALVGDEAQRHLEPRHET